MERGRGMKRKERGEGGKEREEKGEVMTSEVLGEERTEGRS